MDVTPTHLLRLDDTIPDPVRVTTPIPEEDLTGLRRPLSQVIGLCTTVGPWGRFGERVSFERHTSPYMITNRMIHPIFVA